MGDVHTRTEGRQTFPLQWEEYNLFPSEAEVIADIKKSRKVNNQIN